jgi:hypothetical protein
MGRCQGRGAWTAVRESSEATDLPRVGVHLLLDAADQEMTMGDKKKKKKKADKSAVAEIHWVRSTLILLLVVALTLGVWYFVSERD